MAYNYQPSNISKKQKMNMSTWSMQVTSSINNIISLFATTFLVSYIMQVNVDAPISSSIVSIALYHISHYAIMAIMYFFISYLVDRTNRVWFYRLSILVKGAFIVAIIFLGQDLARLSVVAGSIYGFAEALYWSSYNVMKGEIVPRMHADKFAVLNTLFGKVINVVFPVLIGLLIDVSTFTAVAFYVLIIVAIQLMFSFFIKSERPDHSSFQFFDYIKRLRKNTEGAKRIRRFYPVALCYGCTTICTSLVSFMAIYTFKTNLNLGIFTALFAAISVITLIVFKKTTKEGNRKIIYAILGVLPVIAGILVAFNITKVTYIIFNITETVALCVLAYSLDYQRTVILKKTGNYNDIAEHQTLTELTFNVARVFTFALMIVLGLTLDILGFRILCVIISLAFPLFVFFLHRMEKVEKNYPLEIRVVSVEVEEIPSDIKKE